MRRPPTAHLHSGTPTLPHHAGWSFGPTVATAWLWCNAAGETTLATSSTQAVRQWSDPLDALRWMEHFPLGRPTGSRWIGFLSYDLGRRFEHLPIQAQADPRLPLFAFGFYPDCTTPPVEDVAAFSAHSHFPMQSTFTREQYLRAVEHVLRWIRAGDIFQANLSQRFTLPLTEKGQTIWHRALQQSPAALGAWLRFDDLELISLSPELFLHVDAARQVTTRPIKGTRPNRAGNFEQLRRSGKDAAELNMIIDLERNDLGRVCELGSVRVDQPRTIEPHHAVLHGVASVTGRLRPGINFVDLLRATFPGGSVTGAPKIRAMQIIEQLEPVRRHAYCGAIGYLDADGSMAFNVAIRTITMHAGQVHVPVGGGIVADSDPATEYEETLTKAVGMFQALGIAPDVLQPALARLR